MIQGLNHVTVTVNDIDESLAFYCGLLGAKALVRWKTGAYLEAGDLWLCLALGKPFPAGDYSHLAFTVAATELKSLAEKLKRAGVRHWQENRSEGDSLYILDPNGHRLELHEGTLQSRLDSLKHQPYDNLQWLSDELDPNNES